MHYSLMYLPGHEMMRSKKAFGFKRRSVEPKSPKLEAIWPVRLGLREQYVLGSEIPEYDVILARWSNA